MPQRKAGDNMSWIEEKTNSKFEPKPKDPKDPKEPILYKDSEVKTWLTSPIINGEKYCCLLYGSDGTGKSGLCLDYLSPEDIKAEKKIVIIDLDGGNVPLITTYHMDKIKNIQCVNPLVTSETEEGTVIDYQKTFAKIRAIIRYVKTSHKTENIKAIVFDGLSTALKHAEHQMRLDKNIADDGGVMLKYWLIRNKIFIETLEQLKSIPIAKFFIAHEDFIGKAGEELSSVKSKTAQMCFQKIKCERVDSKDKVVFKAIIDKSKYNVRAEGKAITFCEVDKTKDVVKWDTAEVFRCLV